jgi:hypothetical protein
MSTNKDSEAIEALDLSPIKIKLMHVESGEGWTRARADAVEVEYRRFLYLMKKYPDAHISPTVDVDVFWHYHILDTMKYGRDCEQVFGYFLHHYPYVGIGEDSMPDERAQAGERMSELYAAEFGEAIDVEEQALMAPTAGAWCAAPAKKADAAWCAAPAKKADAAWCAAPAKNADAAWCAAPAKKTDAAWCAAPGKKAEMAWCAAPAQPANQKIVSTAQFSAVRTVFSSTDGHSAGRGSPGMGKLGSTKGEFFSTRPLLEATAFA